MNNFELVLLIGVVLVGIISIANLILFCLNKNSCYSDDYSEDVIEIHKELKESIDKASKNYKVYFRTPECKVYEECNVHIATREGSEEKVIIVDLIKRKIKKGN